MHLTFHEITPATLPEFEAFFSTPGAPHFCWCMVWRRGPPAKPGEHIWSIVCFFVPRKRRGQGTVRALIKGAIAHAMTKGATIVEAYPVDRAAPSYRYMGFTDVFAEAGFTDCGMAGTRRHVMRLPVSPPGWTAPPLP
jgi:hypothetical protein